jgi:hypothetical protein
MTAPNATAGDGFTLLAQKLTNRGPNTRIVTSANRHHDEVFMERETR